MSNDHRYERTSSDNLWWVFTWILAFFVFLFLCSCGYPRAHVNVATVAGVHVVDLSGAKVNYWELSEMVQGFAETWEWAGLGTQEDVYSSLEYNPVAIYLPADNAFQCSHVIGGGTGWCAGMSLPDNSTVIFATTSRNEHIACGSIPHELAHTLSYRLLKGTDGNHRNNPILWDRGGVLDSMLVRFECQMKPINLRTW